MMRLSFPRATSLSLLVLALVLVGSDANASVPPPITIDNDIIHAVISVDRGCVTSLIFKQGSNQQLIASSWDRYLLDFGSQDPFLRQYLRSGWRLDDTEIQSSSAAFHLSHPSGFANTLTLTWSPEQVDVTCDITAPEQVEINNDLVPGNGFQSGSDWWAVPATNGVQIGTFNYPGAGTSIYPSSNITDWATPSEGWMAFWNQNTDEVHGFTFSRGYKVIVANGAATDLHFMIPAGTSRIAFHVVKPKPATPYEVFPGLASGPYLTLQKQVDKLFTGAGAELTYTLAYANIGNRNATGVVIQDALPTVVDLVPGSISAGGTYDSATRLITWNVGALSTDAVAQTVSFGVTISSGTTNETKILNTASIFSAEVPVATTANASTTVAAPSISSLSITNGGNAGSVTVTIYGTGLDPSAQVKLTKTGEGDIVATPVTGSSDGTSILATFDLHGKAVGIWQVIVTNPDGQSINLSNAFVIESGGEAKIWLEIVAPNVIRPGRVQTFQLLYGNRGNVDAVGVPLWIAGIPSNATLRLGFDVLPPMPIGDEPADFSQVPTSLNTGDEIVVPLRVPVIPAGFAGTLQVAITIPTSETFQLRAWTNPPLFGSPPSEQALECLFAILDELWSEANPDKDCALAVLGGYRDLLRRIGTHATVNLTWDVFNIGFQCAPAVACKLCVEGKLTPSCVVCVTAEILKYGAHFYNAYQDLKTCAGAGYHIGEVLKQIMSIFSVDPNDKACPAGYDTEGTPSPQRQRFVAGDHALGYMVFFENLSNATAAVQDMMITDQLSTNLDWSTFSLGNIQIGTNLIAVAGGSQSFSTNVDFRPAMPAVVQVSCVFSQQTGLVQWYFKGVNPYTGDFADLLPPNTDAVDPHGRGWVSYSVKPKSDLPTGTTIANQATIDFEVGITPAPMNTPVVFNTIDSGAPQSAVQSLPATVSSIFSANWQGADDLNGSGVRDYTVFVSEDSGSYSNWLVSTTATSGTFTGEVGHTYAFYSIARDNVGNQEGKVALPEATTRVVPTHALNISKLQTKLNFAKANADSCNLTATLDPGAGFNPAGKSVTLHIGGAKMSFTFDSKGRAVGSPGACRLSYSKSKKVWTLTTKLKNGNYQTAWEAYGMVNANLPQPTAEVKVPVTLLLGQETFVGEKTLTYKVKPGKSGTAK